MFFFCVVSMHNLSFSLRLASPFEEKKNSEWVKWEVKRAADGEEREEGEGGGEEGTKRVLSSIVVKNICIYAEAVPRCYKCTHILYRIYLHIYE